VPPKDKREPVRIRVAPKWLGVYMQATHGNAPYSRLNTFSPRAAPILALSFEAAMFAAEAARLSRSKSDHVIPSIPQKRILSSFVFFMAVLGVDVARNI